MRPPFGLLQALHGAVEIAHRQLADSRNAEVVEEARFGPVGLGDQLLEEALLADGDGALLVDRRCPGRRRCGRCLPVRQILASVDVEAKSVQRDGLHETALDAGVDVEGRRLRNRLVPAVEHRVDLRQRHALDGHRHLDEVTGLAAEVRQSLEAAHFPGGRGVGQAQLRDRERPRKVRERSLLLDVLANVDLVQACEIVVHGGTPFGGE
jgi:hypothetical protein